MKKRTTIAIEKETVQKLKRKKIFKHETYDDIIQRLVGDMI